MDEGHVSSWKSLNGSMPQGSQLGPLSFIVMIDNLRAPAKHIILNTWTCVGIDTLIVFHK